MQRPPKRRSKLVEELTEVASADAPEAEPAQLVPEEPITKRTIEAHIGAVQSAGLERADLIPDLKRWLPEIEELAAHETAN